MRRSPIELICKRCGSEQIYCKANSNDIKKLKCLHCGTIGFLELKNKDKK